MRYLNKTELSKVIEQDWQYSTRSHRLKIRAALLEEQKNFCAYTERYIAPVDACDIEHFDDRLKNSEADDYWNWYAVHHWINMHKRRIENFLPIMSPYDETLSARVHYENGAFRPVDEKDTEAINLIEFLGWNSPILAEYRAKTVARIKELRMLYGGDDAGFAVYITADSENLSFITVLEAELGLSLSPD